LILLNATRATCATGLPKQIGAIADRSRNAGDVWLRADAEQADVRRRCAAYAAPADFA
jgi:hypothetical protein